MRGLCHSCLTSDTEIIEHKGTRICMDCYHRSFKQSQENKDLSDPATLEDLKFKWENR